MHASVASALNVAAGGTVTSLSENVDLHVDSTLSASVDDMVVSASDDASVSVGDALTLDVGGLSLIHI